jgi:hypothetical protein
MICAADCLGNEGTKPLKTHKTLPLVYGIVSLHKPPATLVPRRSKHVGQLGAGQHPENARRLPEVLQALALLVRGRDVPAVRDGGQQRLAGAH